MCLGLWSLAFEAWLFLNLSANFKPERTAAASRGFLATAWLSCLFGCSTAILLCGIAESDSAYCDPCYRSVVCPSCTYVTLAHSAKLKPLNATRRHLAGTLVWSQVTLYYTEAPVPHGKWRLGGRKPRFAAIPTLAKSLLRDKQTVTVDTKSGIYSWTVMNVRELKIRNRYIQCVAAAAAAAAASVIV